MFRKRFPLPRPFLLECLLATTSLGGFLVNVPAAEDGDTDPMLAYQLYLKPTPPVEVERIFQEWEPSQALFMTIPAESDLKDDPLRLTFYVDMIRAALPLMPVVIVINLQHEALVSYLMEALVRHGLTEAELEEVTFFIARAKTRWIRDYAPLYGSDTNGAIVVLDSRYTKSFSEYMSAYFAKQDTPPPPAPGDSALESYAYQLDSWEDRFPAEMARYIREQGAPPVKIVRPPVFLEGGDIVTDGRGNLVISMQTLYDNGGSEDQMARVAQEFFGQEQVHYLRQLPRSRVLHLDYVMKFTGPQTCLIAEPYTETLKTPFYRSLSEEVEAALEFNTRYMGKHFPDTKLIPVPMIPPTRDSEEVFLQTVRNGLEKYIAWTHGWIEEETYMAGTEKPLNKHTLDRVLAALLGDTGLLDLDTPENLDKAMQHYFGRTLAQQRFTHTDDTFYFRSYLNSLLLVNETGRARFLVPRFKPIDQYEEEWMPEVEERVEAAYKAALPGADVVWIHSDVMAAMGGAVHCTSHLLPVWKRETATGTDHSADHDNTR